MNGKKIPNVHMVPQCAVLSNMLCELLFNFVDGLVRKYQCIYLWNYDNLSLENGCVDLKAAGF